MRTKAQGSSKILAFVLLLWLSVGMLNANPIVSILNPQSGDTISTALNPSEYIINGTAQDADTVEISVQTSAGSAVLASVPVQNGAWEYKWVFPAPMSELGVILTARATKAGGSPTSATADNIKLDDGSTKPAGSLLISTRTGTHDVFLNSRSLVWGITGCNIQNGGSGLTGGTYSVPVLHNGLDGGARINVRVHVDGYIDSVSVGSPGSGYTDAAACVLDWPSSMLGAGQAGAVTLAVGPRLPVPVQLRAYSSTGITGTSVGVDARTADLTKGANDDNAGITPYTIVLASSPDRQEKIPASVTAGPSISLNRSVIIDTTAPDVDVTSAAASTERVWVSGTVTDSGACPTGPAWVTVELLDGTGASQGTISADLDFEGITTKLATVPWSVVMPGPATAGYTVRVHAADCAGNEAIPAAISVEIPSSTCSLGQLADFVQDSINIPGETAASTGGYELRWSQPGHGSGLIERSSDGASFIGFNGWDTKASPRQDGPVTFTLNRLTKMTSRKGGTWYLVAGTATASTCIDNNPPDLVLSCSQPAPTITIGYKASDTAELVSWSLDDQYWYTSNPDAKLSQNLANGVGDVDRTSTGKYTLNPLKLTPRGAAVHKIILTARDGAGHIATTDSTIEVTDALQAPDLKVQGFASSGEYYASSHFTLVPVSSPSIAEYGWQIRRLHDGLDEMVVEGRWTTTDHTTPISAHVEPGTATPDGKYEYYVKLTSYEASDTGGHAKVTVDTTPPTWAITDPKETAPNGIVTPTSIPVSNLAIGAVIIDDNVDIGTVKVLAKRIGEPDGNARQLTVLKKEFVSAEDGIVSFSCLWDLSVYPNPFASAPFEIWLAVSDRAGNPSETDENTPRQLVFVGPQAGTADAKLVLTSNDTNPIIWLDGTSLAPTFPLSTASCDIAPTMNYDSMKVYVKTGSLAAQGFTHRDLAVAGTAVLEIKALPITQSSAVTTLTEDMIADSEGNGMWRELGELHGTWSFAANTSRGMAVSLGTGTPFGYKVTRVDIVVDNAAPQVGVTIPSTTQTRPSLVPPGGLIIVRFDINNLTGCDGTPDPASVAPIRRASGLGIPDVQMTICNAAGRAVQVNPGASTPAERTRTQYSIAKAVSAPNFTGDGDGSVSVTGDPSRNCTVTWRIPVTRKFAKGGYIIKLAGVQDVLGNAAGEQPAYFRIGLR